MDELTIAVHDQRIALWISRIQECRASGLTVDTWCKQKGLTSKNYYYWMRKIKREAFEAMPEEMRSKPLLPEPPSVPVFAEVSSAATAGSSSAAAVIRCGNMTVEILNDADAQTVENVLRAIRSLC